MVSCPALCLHTPLSYSWSELSMEETFMHKHTDRAFLLLIGCGCAFKLELILSESGEAWKACSPLSCISWNAYISDRTQTLLLPAREMNHWQRRRFPHKATFPLAKTKCRTSLLTIACAQSPGLLRKSRLSVRCKLLPIFCGPITASFAWIEWCPFFPLLCAENDIKSILLMLKKAQFCAIAS